MSRFSRTSRNLVGLVFSFIALLAGAHKASAEDWDTNLGSYNGVTVYSNGSTATYRSDQRNIVNGYDTGVKWQCVEFVRRYFYLVYGLKVGSGMDADGFYSNGLGLRKFANTGTQAPVVGAILCSSNVNDGHVAIIREVGPDYIRVAHQNWSNSPDDVNHKFAMTVINGQYTVLQAGAYIWDGWLLPSGPASPSNLHATAGWENAIDISWTDNSSDETGFAIERRLEGGSWVQINQVNAGVTSYHDQGYNGAGLALNTLYYYRVKAFNAKGSSGFTDELESGTLAPPTNALATFCFTTSIDLAWTNHASFADGYVIERQTGTDPWSEIKRVGAAVTSYHDDGYQGGGLAQNTLYNYRVRACSGSGRSGPTNQIAAPTLGTPTNLRVTGATATSVDLEWTNDATHASGYAVERRTEIHGWAVIADNLGADTTTYRDDGWQGQGLAPGTRYTYKVRALYAGNGFVGYSQYSSEATGETTVGALLPVAKPNSYNFDAGSTLSVAAPGLLRNDEPNGGTAVLVDGPRNAAAFSLDPDGSFDYTPSPGFAGYDRFKYKVANGAGDSSTVTVALNVYPVLATFGADRTAFVGGFYADATVGLNVPAPNGGIRLSISSSDVKKLIVPTAATVKQGSTIENFKIATYTVLAKTSATMTAKYRGVSKTLTFQISPGGLQSLKLSPTTLVAGTISTGTVLLSARAPAAGRVVRLTSDSSFAQVPASVTVPAGATSATFPITTTSVASPSTATITARLGYVQKRADLTVNP